MFTADKVIFLGASAVTAADCYFRYGMNMPTKALYSHLGGIAASSFFSAYYPDYCHVMKEKLGENFTWAATCLYPGGIFLAGYVGGVATGINLFVTGTFFCFHNLISEPIWSIANERIFTEVKTTLGEVKDNIRAKQLQAAGELIERAEDLSQRLTSKNGLNSSRLDDVDSRKQELSKAYLELSTPKFDKAEKWAQGIKKPEIKIDALRDLGFHLLEQEKSAETEAKIEGLIRECDRLLTVKPKPPSGLWCFIYRKFWQEQQSCSSKSRLGSTLMLKFMFAKKYEKTELKEEVKASLSVLGQSEDDIYTLYRLAIEGLKQDDKEFIKHCIALAARRLPKYEGGSFAHLKHFASLEAFQEEIDSCLHFDPYIDLSQLFYLNSSDDRIVGSTMALAFIRVGQIIRDEEIVEQLFQSGILLEHDQITALMESAKIKSSNSLEESCKCITEAVKLIRAYTPPEDVEERELQVVQYRKDAFSAMITYQMKFDLEGAYQTTMSNLPTSYNLRLSIANKARRTHNELARKILAEVDAEFANLSFEERIKLMRLQIVIAPQTLFSSHTRHQAIWDGADPVEQAQALLMLATGYLGFNAPESAKPLINRAAELGAGNEDVQRNLDDLRQTLSDVESRQRIGSEADQSIRSHEERRGREIIAVELTRQTVFALFELAKNLFLELFPGSFRRARGW